MEPLVDPSFLQPTDPSPVEVVNADSSVPVLLLCEHAGRVIPECLGDMGLSRSTLRSHISWDIGAESVARELSRQLSAPLIVQRYSRLVIDGNRPPDSRESIPEISFGTIIPANQNLAQSERNARVQAIFDPMNDAIETSFAKHQRLAAFSIHSFTPHGINGKPRPWHAGFVSRKSLETAEQILASVSLSDPGLTLAVNEPYEIEDETDWFIPVFAEAHGLPHCLIEIRNDQVSEVTGIENWANILAHAIDKVLSGLT